MTDPCVEAVKSGLRSAIDRYYETGKGEWLRVLSDEETELLARAAIAAMHSSRPVEDGFVTRLAVKIAAACRSENFPSYATYETVTARILKEELPGLTTQASELSALKGEIERKDAALIKCRDRFREYEASHERKAREANPGGSNRSMNGEAADRFEKAARNREMADLCSQALTPEKATTKAGDDK